MSVVNALKNKIPIARISTEMGIPRSSIDYNRKERTGGGNPGCLKI
ncbi:MAG: hypothetical protein QXF07_01350 [Candidatus Micrarchaeia archaeon]